MLVLVYERYQLDDRRGPYNAFLMLDRLDNYIVQVLGKQVPQDLVVIGANVAVCEVGSLRDVEDVPHQLQTVLDELHLASGDPLLTEGRRQNK